MVGWLRCLEVMGVGSVLRSNGRLRLFRRKANILGYEDFADSLISIMIRCSSTAVFLETGGLNNQLLFSGKFF